jgi:hypothetical protein
VFLPIGENLYINGGSYLLYVVIRLPLLCNTGLFCECVLLGGCIFKMGLQ